MLQSPMHWNNTTETYNLCMGPSTRLVLKPRWLRLSRASASSISLAQITDSPFQQKNVSVARAQKPLRHGIERPNLTVEDQGRR